jgi:hypothetical protein
MKACLLECGHSILFQANHMPSEGEILWCERCTMERAVILNAVEWWARCRFRDCHYSRRFGDDEQQAKLAANKHSRVCGHPLVELMREERIVPMRGAQ